LSTVIDTLLPDSLDSMRPVRTLLTSPLTILVFGVIAVTIAYRVLPPKAPRWRSILPAAILVGIAITLLTQLFTFLVPFLVGAAAIAGSLASAFVALAWLSFSFQALLYGASWVRVAELRAAAAQAGQTD
jgi:uncharacterized BrkB/YihY/UPF0761 family membrane protein